MGKPILRFFAYLLGGLVALVVVAIAYMAHADNRVRETAQAFCASVKAGDDPEQVFARARGTTAERSSLVWRGLEGEPKTLELMFMGAIPLSMHLCSIRAAEKVISATYSHYD